MKTLVLATLLAAVAARAATADSSPRLFVEDGQLVSHAFVVFVTRQIDESMEPQLVMLGDHLLTAKTELERQPQKPRLVASHQTRSVVVAKQSITVEGTLLTFDFEGTPLPWFKSAIRLRPVLQWSESAGEGKPKVVMRAVAQDEIFVGRLPGALLWTAVTMGVILGILFSWSVEKGRTVTPPPYLRPGLFLITGSDGYLSLWRAQLWAWTITIGTMVFLFGVLRLKVPDIPDALVVLMGFSTVTGFSAAKASAPATAALAAPPNPGRPLWSDLVSTYNPLTQKVELSVPKAQMFLWTVVVIILFIAKSVLEGVLWEIPWGIVWLTGVSQAGYVGEKIAK